MTRADGAGSAPDSDRSLDLTRPATARAVARRAGVRGSRRLGQHFLVDASVRDAIVDALAPLPDDTVVEIGCGIGTLTSALAARAGRVIALDVDAACVRAARITQRHHDHVTVARADARQLRPAEFGLGAGWLAAGNLPYRLTGALLGHLVELEVPPSRGVFLVQREVAARLTAAPGDWGLATVALRSLAKVDRLADVAPGAFSPPPAVHSSIIRLLPAPALAPDSRATVLHLARAVFQQRRKTLRHGVAHALDGDADAAADALRRAGVDPARRPGTLGLDEWSRLARAVTGLRDSG